MSSSPAAPSLDPRVRRTRELLFEAFQGLLQQKGFDAISVSDVAERAGVNRGTFYDHFDDKFALLEAMMAERLRFFIGLRLEGRAPGCLGALKQFILAACDFLAEAASGCQKHQKQFEPLIEAQLKSVLREALLPGLQAHKARNPELKATLIAWSVAGAALDWSRKRKPAAEAFADTLLPIVHATLDV